jgi:L-alanine-DL-glutamate epimerase-like enolase superfamily enzyme
MPLPTDLGAPTGHTIDAVDVAAVRGSLPEPIRFGDWYMPDREFAVVRVRTSAGVEGFGFTLTREGPVAEAIRKSIAPRYLGRSIDDPAAAYQATWSSNLSTLCGGSGLRGLSIVDLAVWDALARTHERSITRLLGGEPAPMPATAIIGYPPTLDAAGVGQQVAGLYEAGWRRFKMAIAGTPELTRERFAAAAEAAPGCELSMDAAWMFRDVDAAAAFLEAMPVRLGWYEDVFPPGDAGLVAELRRRVDTPIAMGDEQGGSYYPEALLALDAVDVVRVDFTCMGGISGAHRVIDRTLDAGVRFAPHMFAHVHSQVLPGLGHTGLPIEWGVPWTGVDPYADSLRQPEIVDGLMRPLDEQPGFGPMLNREWLSTQRTDDPEGIFT